MLIRYSNSTVTKLLGDLLSVLSRLVKSYHFGETVLYGAMKVGNAYLTCQGQLMTGSLAVRSK